MTSHALTTPHECVKCVYCMCAVCMFMCMYMPHVCVQCGVCVCAYMHRHTHVCHLAYHARLHVHTSRHKRETVYSPVNARYPLMLQLLPQIARFPFKYLGEPKQCEQSFLLKKTRYNWVSNTHTHYTYPIKTTSKSSKCHHLESSHLQCKINAGELEQRPLGCTPQWFYHCSIGSKTTVSTMKIPLLWYMMLSCFH